MGAWRGVHMSLRVYVCGEGGSERLRARSIKGSSTDELSVQSWYNSLVNRPLSVINPYRRCSRVSLHDP